MSHVESGSGGLGGGPEDSGQGVWRVAVDAAPS